MSWLVKDQVRVDARYWALRSMGFDAHDAHLVSRYLEIRLLCHQRIGGVVSVEAHDPHPALALRAHLLQAVLLRGLI